MTVKLSVRPVTALANGARAAPGRPAAYGRRSGDQVALMLVGLPSQLEDGP
jgi:hypothetical protein